MSPLPKQTVPEAANQLQSELKTSLNSGNFSVPILPKVANEILQMSQDPDSDMGELSRLVHQDQSIAGSVLRIANSAAFAPSERIVSLQQAVSWLGLQLLTEIALSVAVQANVFNSVRYKGEIANMWKHALGSAVFGKEIARSMRRNVEGQYLCGLLHSIGKPVVLKAVESLEDSMGIELTLEQAIQTVELYHVRVGGFVTAEWNLPASVQIANQFYSDYEDAPEFKIETAITHLADKLSTAIIEDSENTQRDLQFDPVFTFLNIYPDDRKAIFEKSDEVKELMSSMTI